MTTRAAAGRERRVILAHPGVGPFVQQAARALDDAGLLAAYVTSFAYRPGSALGRVLRAGLGERELARRRVTEVPDDRVRTHPLPELLRMLAVKLPLSPLIADLVWEQTELAFDRIVARRHVRRGGAVYGYEHAALATMRAQKARGGCAIYEMPICHHQTTAALLDPEFACFPGAETPYDVHLRRLAPRRNARKDAELRLADRIVVNSGFTKDSLVRAGVPAARITVIPLGAPPVAPGPLRLPDGPPDSPFVFLSAGQQSVRKGTHYLLDAWRRLAPGPEAELWLVGSMLLPPRLLADLPGTVVIRPAVPRAELFDLYRRAGVLVFPSLCEGFGMVITEALAQGLPVITTPHTGGPELITPGEQGWLVPIRDTAALVAAMQWCLDHRAAVAAMRPHAVRAAANWQWQDYRTALGQAVGLFLAEQEGEQGG